MTLDEAIKEFTDCAKDNRKEQNYWAAERNESYDEANPLSDVDCEGFMREAEARAEYHEQLAEWLTELKNKQWISCKDKMPDDNELVLFCYVGESGIKSVHYGYHQTVRGLGSSWGKISGGWRYCNDDVTHWMPLPEPPKDGDEE